MENWALEPEVLKVYAKHYKTGEVIPAALVEKIRKAEQFNQGFITVEYLAASFLDMDWHTLTPGPAQDATAFEQASLARDPDAAADRRRATAARTSTTSSGRAAATRRATTPTSGARCSTPTRSQAFKEKGLFDQATARAFRTILEKGGTEDADGRCTSAFRGREPSVEPLLEQAGLK